MARTELKDTWVTDTHIESAKSILRNFCDKFNMKISTWNSTNDLYVIASQGSRAKVRIWGTLFTKVEDWPKLAKIQLVPTDNVIRVTVEIEEDYGFALLSAQMIQKYEEYFYYWMQELNSVLPPTITSKQTHDFISAPH
jgi:hypothetical protein